MFSVDLSTREWDGHVVVALSGELDLVDAADVGAALDDFSVHASVEGAAASARRSRRVVVPLRRLHRTRWPMTVKDGPALPSTAPNMARREPATVVLFPGCGNDR